MVCLSTLVAMTSFLTVGWLWQTPATRGQETYASAPCPGCVAVFYPGLNGSKCYRIPMLLKTRRGTLLAVAENRIANCGDNGGRHDLVVRRSTDDGKTWGDLSVVYKGNKQHIPCLTAAAAISNPNLVEVDFHNGSSALLMHFDTLANPNMACHGLMMQIWSHDDGQTWGNSTTLDFGDTLANVGEMPGPAQGLQGASGKIYFPSRGIVGQNVSNFLYWSHDFGQTWKASNETLNGSFQNEASIAFLESAEDERIIMNFRTSQGRRAQAIWGLNHTPSEVFWPQGLVDPGCQGSIVNDGGVLFLSNAAEHSRSHVTVKSSHDHGKTWSAGHLVWHGPSAYSQLAPLGGGRLGLLFEAGVKSPYETISYAQVNASDVEVWLPPPVVV